MSGLHEKDEKTGWSVVPPLRVISVLQMFGAVERSECIAGRLRPAAADAVSSRRRVLTRIFAVRSLNQDDAKLRITANFNSHQPKDASQIQMNAFL